MSPTHPPTRLLARPLLRPPTDEPPRPATAAGTDRRTAGAADRRTAGAADRRTACSCARGRHARRGRPKADLYTRRSHAKAKVNANPGADRAAYAEVDGG
ncbi:hypothetical protein AV521_03130 [Streptomyces sp. IMTB 2501]|nr:hypothetical protein AV521_03130 [Streptomyces sp. IMTB 2501]